jgi:hypothetical protein
MYKREKELPKLEEEGFCRQKRKQLKKEEGQEQDKNAKLILIVFYKDEGGPSKKKALGDFQLFPYNFIFQLFFEKVKLEII